MFPITSPTDLYEEYQARVAAAVEQATRVPEARRVPGVIAWLRWQARRIAHRLRRAGYPQAVDSGT